MSAVTQWFKFATPERPGMYQRLNEASGMIYFSVFDGWWFRGDITREGAQAAANRQLISLRQIDPDFPWRGLAEKP